MLPDSFYGHGVKDTSLLRRFADARPHSTLREWIDTNDTVIVSADIEARLSFGIQIFRALGCLHASKFVLQNLAPHNILLYDTGTGHLRLAITNFGFSTPLGSNHARRMCETPCYMAPSQWRQLRARNPSRDIWSACLILAELFGQENTAHAREEYNRVCMHFQNGSHQDICVQKLVAKAQNIASALKQDADAILFHEDAELDVEFMLGPVRCCVSTLVEKCFNLDQEMDDGILPTRLRPTSSECETDIVNTWNKFFPSWNDHYVLPPSPKCSEFQSLGSESRERLRCDLVTQSIRRVRKNYRALLRKMRVRVNRVSNQEFNYVENKIKDLTAILGRRAAQAVAGM